MPEGDSSGLLTIRYDRLARTHRRCRQGNDRDAGATEVSVVGPTCVIGLLGERRMLPSLREGDLLAVLDVGG